MEDYEKRLFVVLDVSLATNAICVISEHRKILKEAEVLGCPQSGLNICDRTIKHSLNISVGARILQIWAGTNQKMARYSAYRRGQFCHTEKCRK